MQSSKKYNSQKALKVNPSLPLKTAFSTMARYQSSLVRQEQYFSGYLHPQSFQSNLKGSLETKCKPINNKVSRLASPTPASPSVRRYSPNQDLGYCSDPDHHTDAFEMNYASARSQLHGIAANCSQVGSQAFSKLSEQNYLHSTNFVEAKKVEQILGCNLKRQLSNDGSQYSAEIMNRSFRNKIPKITGVEPFEDYNEFDDEGLPLEDDEGLPVEDGERFSVSSTEDISVNSEEEEEQEEDETSGDSLIPIESPSKCFSYFNSVGDPAQEKLFSSTYQRGYHCYAPTVDTETAHTSCGSHLKVRKWSAATYDSEATVDESLLETLQEDCAQVGDTFCPLDIDDIADPDSQMVGISNTLSTLMLNNDPYQ